MLLTTRSQEVAEEVRAANREIRRELESDRASREVLNSLRDVYDGLKTKGRGLQDS